MRQYGRHRERPRKRALPILISLILFLSGCGMLLYPALSNWLSSRHQSELYVAYQDQVAELDDGDAEAELQKAQNYNTQLADQVKLVSDPFQNGTADTAEYDALLNVTPAGVMGYVEIPSIGVFLPIYHGVSNDVLMKGVGHLPETSMPVGGPSTHAVLAGHSGMSSARLFTDLTKLKMGDVFYIHVYDRTLTYTVDQIKKAVPTDTSDLQIVDGADYVTLVTCVPVGVNSHRLLVRGKRTA